MPNAAIRARWCSLRLAIQPALAGIKHLNRLENVLARSEWHDPQIAEGLLCDARGRVIGGTMSNLFLLHKGVLVTPMLDGSGVAGVTREIIIEKARAEQFVVDVTEVTPDMVHSADAVFLVNSVIGAWQVIALGESFWKDDPIMDRVRGWIAHG
jgi:4-amino-4-deoxychorismate lyase